jgi:hypothetical protein
LTDRFYVQAPDGAAENPSTNASPAPSGADLVWAGYPRLHRGLISFAAPQLVTEVHADIVIMELTSLVTNKSNLVMEKPFSVTKECLFVMEKPFSVTEECLLVMEKHSLVTDLTFLMTNKTNLVVKKHSFVA